MYERSFEFKSLKRIGEVNCEVATPLCAYEGLVIAIVKSIIGCVAFQPHGVM